MAGSLSEIKAKIISTEKQAKSLAPCVWFLLQSLLNLSKQLVIFKSMLQKFVKLQQTY